MEAPIDAGHVMGHSEIQELDPGLKSENFLNETLQNPSLGVPDNTTAQLEFPSLRPTDFSRATSSSSPQEESENPRPHRPLRVHHRRRRLRWTNHYRTKNLPHKLMGAWWEVLL